MKKEFKKADWAVIIIFSLLAVVLMARGGMAVGTGVYESTARYSGPYTLYGTEARFMGGTFIGLGLLVLSSIGYQLELNKKLVSISVACAGLFSVICFVVKFFVTP